MADATQWAGFVKDILTGVHGAVDGAKANLGSGVAVVEIGERGDHFETPAVFIHTPENGPMHPETSREEYHQYEVPVEIVCVTRSMTKSDDDTVLEILETIADELDKPANDGLGGTEDHEFPTAPAAVPSAFNSEEGVYETVGRLQVSYYKWIDRTG